MLITSDNAIKVLKRLKESAECVERNEDSIFEDERDVASYEMREIIETLLNLEIE